jgi:exopolyphosphatase/guanosine-5'-triphosphate,3'-diphosphate pyrophosphatase
VLLASGGTANALGRLALARRADGGKLARRGERAELARLTHGLVLGGAELTAVRIMLEPMPLAERALAPGLRPERADVIVTGAVLFEELLAASELDALTVSRTSVREAVLWREALKLAR